MPSCASLLPELPPPVERYCGFSGALHFVDAPPATAAAWFLRHRCVSYPLDMLLGTWLMEYAVLATACVFPGFKWLHRHLGSYSAWFRGKDLRGVFYYVFTSIFQISYRKTNTSTRILYFIGEF